MATNPYMLRYGNVFAPERGDAQRRKDAGAWGSVASAAPGIGTALGGIAGGLLGTFALPGLGTAAGATMGGGIGNALGQSIGGLAQSQSDQSLDPVLEREMRKQAILQAIMGMRR